jgi:hypothetical protein
VCNPLFFAERFGFSRGDPVHGIVGLSVSSFEHSNATCARKKGIEVYEHK